MIEIELSKNALKDVFNLINIIISLSPTLYISQTDSLFIFSIFDKKNFLDRKLIFFIYQVIFQHDIILNMIVSIQLKKDNEYMINFEGHDRKTFELNNKKI